MSNAQVLLKLDELIAKVEDSNYPEEHVSLIIYLKGLSERIATCDYSHDNKAAILSQVSFIAGYCRALFHQSRNINWSTLETSVLNIMLDYSESEDTLWEE